MVGFVRAARARWCPRAPHRRSAHQDRPLPRLRARRARGLAGLRPRHRPDRVRALQPPRGLPRPPELPPGAARPTPSAAPRRSSSRRSPPTPPAPAWRGADPALPPVRGRNAQPPRGSSTQLPVPSAGVLVTATWGGDPAVVKRALGVHTLTARQAAGPPPAHARTSQAPRHPPRRRPGLHRARVRRLLDAERLGHVGVERLALPRRRGLRRRRQRGLCPAQSHRDLGPAGVGGGLGAAPDLRRIASAEQRLRVRGDRTRRRRRPRARRPPTTPSTRPRRWGSRPATRSTTTWRTTGAAGPTPPRCWRSWPRGRPSFTPAGTPRASTAARAPASPISSPRSAPATPSPTRSGTPSGTARRPPAALTSPRADWPNHQRLHQYQGGHNATYGGVTINIDSDYVDAGAASGNVLCSRTARSSR